MNSKAGGKYGDRRNSDAFKNNERSQHRHDEHRTVTYKYLLALLICAIGSLLQTDFRALTNLWLFGKHFDVVAREPASAVVKLRLPPASSRLLDHVKLVTNLE